jgi:GAF domain-containing protein
LESVLNLSLSKYGFIGEVLFEDGQPYLKEHALSNIAWSPETVALSEQFHAEGLEFRNLKTLLGEVMLTGKTVIANDPPNDNRAHGTPEGHPALLAFLGIPVFRGQELIGMIGLGNRAGGYDQQVVDELAPVIATCANFITGYRMEQERKVMLQQIANSRAVVRNLVDRIPAGIVYETPERKVEFVNETFIKMFGLNAKPSQLVGRSCTDEPLVGRSLLVDPVKFDVGLINASTATESILKEAFDLVDGRRLERDCIVVESNGAVRGYLWCYRDITRTKRTRTTDNLEPIDPMSYI